MSAPIKQTLLNATTSTKVSDPFGVSCAERVTLSFTRTGHVSGSAVFTVQASIDGKDGNYITSVNMFKNVPNNFSQDKARMNSVELLGNDTVFYALDLEDFAYDYIQVRVTENGEGVSTCKVLMVED